MPGRRPPNGGVPRRGLVFATASPEKVVFRGDSAKLTLAKSRRGTRDSWRLRPMFGEWGGLILQVTISIVIVLGLIAVVYWLVRRYSSGGLGRIGRGRVPR